MKQASSVVACVLGLACTAAPAWAGDVAQIGQGGASNNAVIEQIATAGNNFATVRQGDPWQGGSGNNAMLMQHAVDNSMIDVYQSGYNSQYHVYQHDGSNLQANVNVNSAYYGDTMEGNTVMIDQSGYGARAWVEQGGSMYSRAEIVQRGWGGENFADVMQSGSGNQAMIYQEGSNQGSIYQAGSNLNATIVQISNGYGYGNSATIRQGY